jgi:hypothetical protein
MAAHPFFQRTHDKTEKCPPLPNKHSNHEDPTPQGSLSNLRHILILVEKLAQHG